MSYFTGLDADLCNKVRQADFNCFSHRNTYKQVIIVLEGIDGSSKPVKHYYV